MPPLAAQLDALPPNIWRKKPPAVLDSLTALEAQLRVTFPEDFRDLLLYSNGGALRGPHAAMTVENLAGIDLQTSDDVFLEYLPGLLVFGDDGGGKVYAFDPENRLGGGPWAIYLVPMSAPGYDTCHAVGCSITETVQRILAGEDFFELRRSEP